MQQEIDDDNTGCTGHIPHGRNKILKRCRPIKQDSKEIIVRGDENSGNMRKSKL